MSIPSGWFINNDIVKTSAMEMIAQDIEKFNAASNGTIQLITDPLAGDYETEYFNTRIDGLVGERTPYTDSAVTPLNMVHDDASRVKIHRQLKPVNIDPSQFTIMLESPDEGSRLVGEQAGPAMLQDMINTAIGTIVAAMAGTPAIVVDGITGETITSMTFAKFNKAQRPMGDANRRITAWVMHSVPFFDLVGDSLANTNQLFVWGDLAVYQDFMGRPIIVTDSPNLINLTPTPDEYRVLGLTAGALQVQQNGDLFSNLEMKNGNTNIKATIQSEYSYNLEVKGYSWDTVNGGKAPTNAALFTSTNWDKWVVSDKNGPGTLMNVRGS